MTQGNNEERHSRLVLTITCDMRLTDSITDFMLGVLEAGVEVGVEDDLVEHTLHVYLEEESPPEARVQEIVSQVTRYLEELAQIFSSQVPVLDWELTSDEDWGRNWKAYFKPFVITPGLVIKPSWEEYSPGVDEKVIEMDPGMAFGTGHHATTSLCMEFIRDWLADNPESGVLDIGTGTGILAMAAALFGSPEVLGIDNDPDAVEAAATNVMNNQLDSRVTIEGTPLVDVENSFSLVVANIIHDVLVEMLPDIGRLTAPGGGLILSGILREGQADNIISLYSEAGFSLLDRREKDEWAALYFSRK